MRRQARPFIVEVRHKRASSRRDRSIWNGLDLAAVTAETAKDLEIIGSAVHSFVDSNAQSIDAENSHNLQAEHHMADPHDAETVETPAEAPDVETIAEPKKKAPRQKKANIRSRRSAEKNDAGTVGKAVDAPTAGARAGRKNHSKEERAQKLGQIETSLRLGESLKSAVRQVGISEQTYYQWKKAAGSAAPVGDLRDLAALEEENERLKKLLAERLRQENAELRKKLGLLK